MDQDLQQRIDEAKAAGYSDEEIQAVLGTATAVPSKTETTPVVPVLTPEEKARIAQENAVNAPDTSEEKFATGMAGVGLGAAAVGVPYLAYKAGRAILSPAVQSGAELAQRGVSAMQDANAIARQTEARVAANQAAKAAAAAPKPVAPSPILDQFGRPITTAPQPVAPGAAPMAQAAENAAARAPSLLDKTNSMIRQLAANKVVQGLSKGMTGLQMATYSPELGPKTPQVGRMRGMEINPLTNAPWTPDQIKQYEANPNVFDQQMAQPQMRR